MSQICPYCNQTFTRLQRHLQQNQRCNSATQGGDQSLLFYIDNENNSSSLRQRNSTYNPNNTDVSNTNQSSTTTLPTNSVPFNSSTTHSNNFLPNEGYVPYYNLFDFKRERTQSFSHNPPNQSRIQSTDTYQLTPQTNRSPNYHTTNSNTTTTYTNDTSNESSHQFDGNDEQTNSIQTHTINVRDITDPHLISTLHSENILIADNASDTFDISDEYSIQDNEDNNEYQTTEPNSDIEQLNHNTASPAYLHRSTTNQRLLSPSNTNGTNLSPNTTRSQSQQTSPTHHLGYLYDFRSPYQFTIINLQEKLIPIPPELIQCIRLLKIMDESNIPQSSFSKVIKWHNHTTSKLIFQNIPNNIFIHTPRMPQSHSSMIKQIAQIICNYDETVDMNPQTYIIKLHSDNYTKITRFPLKAMIYSLFLSPTMMDSKNCHLHNKYYRNPNLLSSISDSNRVLGDIYTGTWFLNAYKEICNDPNDVLVPIILFCDETPIDAYGRLGLDAILFTLGCFNREVRNLDKAWRLLGYVPNVNKNYTNCNNTKHIQTQKRLDYHAALNFMLQEIYDLEQSDGILYGLISDCGQRCEQIRLRFTLMLVSGDAPGLDKLADMYASYSTSSKYVCRDCDCKSENLNRYDMRCTFINRENITSKDRNELEQICFYKVPNNAFDRHNFGGDPSKINGCSPPEILHQFLLGVIKMELKYFSNAITNKCMKEIDKSVKFISQNFNRQSNRSLPDIGIFRDGFDKSHLTGKEFINQIFVLYITLAQTYNMYLLPSIDNEAPPRSHTIKKQKILPAANNLSNDNSNQRLHSQYTEYLEQKMVYDKVLSNRNNMNAWINLLEHTLCFYEWIHQTEIPYKDFMSLHLSSESEEMNDHEDDSSNNTNIDEIQTYTSRADKATRIFLKNFTSVVKELSGNQTCTAKIHWILHLEHYAKKFGAFVNYEGGIGERMLKTIVKQSARKTQRRQHLLASQACKRYYERCLVSTMNDLLDFRQENQQSNNLQQYDQHDTHITNLHTDETRDSQSNSFLSSKKREYNISGKYNIITNEDNPLAFKKITWPQNPSKKNNTTVTHNEIILQRIIRILRSEKFSFTGPIIKCFTTLKFNIDQGGNRRNKNSRIGDQTLFRADPCFYGKPWMDWCITAWSSDSTQDDGNPNTDSDPSTFEFFPALLYMFIDPREMEFTDKTTVLKEKGILWAVIRCTMNDSRSTSPNTNIPRRKYNHLCNLIDTYELEDALRIISVDSIEKDAFVVCDSDQMGFSGNDDSINIFGSTRIYTSKHVMLIKDVTEWPNLFINHHWDMQDNTDNVT